MSNPGTRLRSASDRVVSIALAVLLIGSVLGFGGAAWWSPGAIAVLASTLVLARVAGLWGSGRWPLLRSPLAGLGVLAVGLAAFQSAPMPARVGEAVSPRGREARSLGVLADLARSDDPDVSPPVLFPGPSPLTIDRPATLRWAMGALACLSVFWVVSHHADRLGRLYLVWGSVLAAFLLNTAIIGVGLIGQVDGLYGFVEPGKGPAWAPTLADTLAGPGMSSPRSLATPPGRPTPHAWALAEPDRTPLLGTMLGGPGAYLALGSLGLPLALAVTLQLMAPRGSRQGLWSRLGESGQGSLLVFLYGTTVASAGLIGVMAGPVPAIPFAGAVVLIGATSLVGTGLGGKGVALTGLTLAAMGAGVALGESWAEAFPTASPPPRIDLAACRDSWSTAARVARDFPVVGVGLGAYPAIEPYSKSRDASSSTAMSSVLQWWAEAGSVGVGLVAAGLAWIGFRLPRAIRRVGSADRALAAGMVGAVACFGAFSAIHWTVELPAMALAAAAVAGTCNRWLAGGTDLLAGQG